jgi:predicted aspartyl protease
MRRPIPSLGGRQDRPQPVIPVSVIGPKGTHLGDCLLDTGADDTVFPESVADKLGIDLTNAPVGEASGVGLVTARIRYALVTLRVATGQERREWPAWVAFTSAPMKRPLLGFAGFLQFFTAKFEGDREEVELIVNSLYPGT